ncbi:tRNA pseudouridine synthase A [Thermaurantimonas aggregans]|uniref:tRNA pseudouridine synthase A n=2 Tax=Thermaurantimonas aggregans TaxID=2173829 RepID=A0A401XHT6_9FLAO|nr:tRNA pseudouridine synthase A [Thermaurantimonas aggregans]
MAFHGWQIQPNSITVQQTLNEALSTVLRHDVYAVGAGRTDTGVHARQMFAHFDTSEPIDDLERLTRSLNGILYPNIAVNQVLRVRDDAHARFSATEREYQYDIHYKHNPFLYQRSLLWLWQPFEVADLNRISQRLLGEKDFSCFEKTGGNNKHSFCQVRLAKWTETDVGIRFTIRANRFLRNMVRAIVGTLLDYGSGKLSEVEFASILESGDRRQAGASVPPYALYLTQVCYPDTIFIANE